MNLREVDSALVQRRIYSDWRSIQGNSDPRTAHACPSHSSMNENGLVCARAAVPSPRIPSQEPADCEIRVSRLPSTLQWQSHSHRPSHGDSNAGLALLRVGEDSADCDPAPRGPRLGVVLAMSCQCSGGLPPLLRVAGHRHGRSPSPNESARQSP